MRLFEKQSPQTDRLLMLMLGKIHEEIEQLKQKSEKDKREILEAIWARDLHAAK